MPDACLRGATIVPASGVRDVLGGVGSLEDCGAAASRLRPGPPGCHERAVSRAGATARRTPAGRLAGRPTVRAERDPRGNGGLAVGPFRRAGAFVFAAGGA